MKPDAATHLRAVAASIDSLNAPSMLQLLDPYLTALLAARLSVCSLELKQMAAKIEAKSTPTKEVQA